MTYVLFFLNFETSQYYPENWHVQVVADDNIDVKELDDLRAIPQKKIDRHGFYS